MSPDDARKLFPSQAEAQAALRLAIQGLPFLDAVPVLRKDYERPEHLTALADVYERAFKAARGACPPVRALVSAPSQVGKTSLGEVASACWLARAPQDFLAFLSYGQDLADIKSSAIRDDVRSLGVALREDTTAKNLWRTKEGGGLLARGLAGGITGQSGLVLLDIDDPYRNRLEAESAAHKERIWRDVTATVFSRVGPRTSIIIKHTRYTPDDLIGRLEKEQGQAFESYRIPAVDDEGQPIVKLSGMTADFWAEKRRLMGEHDWWSLMMGLPRPREGNLFKGIHAWDRDPELTVGRTVIGIDLAYSTKSSADYSVAVVLTKTDHRCYIRHVERCQEPAPVFAQKLLTLRQRFGLCPMRAYVGGTERGTIDFLARDGIHIEAIPATQDKWSRAQATSAAWNAGDIMVPVPMPDDRVGGYRDTAAPAWVYPLTSEVLDFTPTARHDDQVDALVAAYDGAVTTGGEASFHTPPRAARPWDGSTQSGMAAGMPIRRKPWES